MKTRSVLPALRALIGVLCLAILYIPNVRAAGEPPAGAACVVTAGNRSAPLAADGSYQIYNIPGNTGAIRARATCNDGSIGQSAVAFTDPTQPATIELGPITFGQLDPVPLAVTLSAPDQHPAIGSTSQLSLLAVAADGTTRDVTPRSEGTTYLTSNVLLATVSDNGLVTFYAQFAPGSSARVIASATAEGSVSSTLMYTLGPRGRLTGHVRRADGTTTVAGVQVSVLRLQPMEQAGTATSDLSGAFSLEDVSAGTFLVSAIDPATGDRALGSAAIANEGETADVTLTLNGQGTVNVTVVDAANAGVANAQVTLTALGAYRDTRTLATDASGKVTFPAVPAGDFTVSTRDPVTRLIGTAVATLAPGQTMPITLRLQPIGAVQGVVRDVDGVTPKSDVQVRILSRQRGLLTQAVTAQDGAFYFDTLPISDGPFTLDAFVDGRLRARVPGVVISQANQTVQQDIVLGSVGTVSGHVLDSQNHPYANAHVTLQSLAGLRLTFDAQTDANGSYFMPAVPVGDFEVTAVTDSNATGHAAGSVHADGDAVTVDVVIADNTLSGQVFLRDAATPAGAGVDVYLAPTGLGPRYTYVGVDGVAHASTDASGRFSFPLQTTGAYYVQAEQGLDRGRSQAVVINLNAGQALQTNVVFLAKGLVTGKVRDPNGMPQAGVPVLVRTQGAFNASRTTTTDASGDYAMDGVFAGDVIAVATNTVTQLSGVSFNRLDAEGQHLVLDITLAGTGSVQGRILARDDSVVADPVRLTVRSNGTVFTELDLANGASYRIDYVPLGDLQLDVEHLADGDRGTATTRIETANETKTIDVRLVGLGSVHASIIDDNGVAVSGARVTVTTRLPYVSSQELTSDDTGHAAFARVFAGDITVTATKTTPLGAVSGSASATLLPYGDAPLTVTLQTQPIGRIHGTVLQPDGVTPAPAGLVVRMLPEPYLNAYVTHTDALGNYAFEGVGSGTYTIDVLRFYDPVACPSRDRVRGRASNVQILQPGDDINRSIQLIGQGQVSGTVTTEDGTPAAGIQIRLTNPDPIYGLNVTCSNRTTYDTTTDVTGQYLLPDVPPGDFSMTAQSADLTQRAEGRSRVRFDGDVVVLDLTLVGSAVSMPQTLYDANGFKFDISGDGSIATGTNNVFAGAGADTSGMHLEIVYNGASIPFKNGNGTVGMLTKDGQQLEVDEDNVSGLTVTRRIYTPRGGYFTRYVEVLDNPSQNPITVQLKAISNHRTANSNPRVVDSSDGDQILSVIDPLNRDRWIVVDDQADADPFSIGSASIPATGHMFDGAGGALEVNSASYNLVGQTGKLTYQWGDITVPPGGEVALMHFVFHQLNRFSAHEAALRLAQLPPEAIDDLTTDERQAIRNFAVPDQSTVAPLPNLAAGVITGQMLSGDGVTPVAAAIVTFKSKHELFGRARTATTDAQGNFEFRSRLDGTALNAVIPVYAFDLFATHPVSGAPTATTPSDFPSTQTQTTQNLIFVNTGNVRGAVKRFDGALLADATVRLCLTDNRNSCGDAFTGMVNRTQSGGDGSYTLLANPPNDYFLFADKVHPQGAPIWGRATVRVTAGDVSVAEIDMEPTGSISGIVRAADGTPVVNASISLNMQGDGSGRARATNSDTAGRYRFFDVLSGAVHLRANDSISGAQGDVDAVVQTGVETNQDIALGGFGTLTVHVEFARGGAAAGAEVIVPGGGLQNADANGTARFQVPVGNYSITAFHPDFASSTTKATGTAVIAQNGDQVDVTVRLGAAGVVFGTIIRPDGTTLASGFPFTITPIRGNPSDARGGLQTAPAGTYRVAGIPVGGYLLTAYDAAQDRFAEAEFDVTDDGQEVELDLTLLPNRIALPATMNDANRFVFDVQRSGALQTGSAAFGDAGSQLQINGTAVVGDSSAKLEANRRQFTIEQPALIGGLKVTRKIYVPRGAYFARYIEVLENTTAAPIAANVVLSNVYAGGAPVATSSGDTGVDTADRWVTIDDAADDDILLVGGMPATSHVFAGVGGAVMPAAVHLDALNSLPRLSESWNNLNVPANGRVALMHFVVQQINRRGAQAAVDRLGQLPPEVLADMTTDDAAAIVNFAVPANLTSSVDPLPSLLAQVNGVTYEGDVRTPVRGAQITVQSDHPLFNRIWGKVPDPLPECPPGTPVNSLRSLVTINPSAINPPPLGSYVLQGQLTAIDSIAMPEGSNVEVRAQAATPCFGDYSGHSFTHVPSRVASVQLSGTQAVIFDTGIFTGTAVGAADYSVTSGRMYRSIDDPNPPVFMFVPIAADGTYVFPGVAPGTYDLLFDTPHPESSGSDGGLRGERQQVQIDVGQVLVTDIPMQPTGQLQGAIVSAHGEASVNATVTLHGDAADQDYDQCATNCVAATLQMHKGKRVVDRTVHSDSLGRYALHAVPAGSYMLTVTDPISLGQKSLALQVSAGQVAVQNVTLLALGSIQLTVLDSGGAPVADAYVYLTAQAVDGEHIAGRTDPQGHLTIANVPIGDYTLRVVDPTHPDDVGLMRTASGTITQDGQVDTQTVTLSPLAAVVVNVQSVAGAPVANANVYLTAAAIGIERPAGHTDTSGQLTIYNVPLGNYSLRIVDPRNPNNADLWRTATGTLTSNGQVDTQTITLLTVGSINLTVKSTAGSVVANARAFLTIAGGTESDVGQTNAQGHLLIANAVRDNYTLRVSDPRFPTLSVSVSGTIMMDGQVDAQIVTLPAIGAIDLTVRAANGALVANTSVEVSSASVGSGFQPAGNTDAQGHLLVAVPLGGYTLRVFDPHYPFDANVARTASGTIAGDGQVDTLTVTFLAFGSADLTVHSAAGAGIANADVYLLSDVMPYATSVGHTDNLGRLHVVSVPQGNYVLQVYDPRFPGDSTMVRTATGTIVSDGQNDAQSVTLKIRATLHVLVVDATAGNAPIANAHVLSLLSGAPAPVDRGHTNSGGSLSPFALDEGSYLITAFAPDGRRATSTVVADVSVDGQTVERTLSITATSEQFGELSFLGESHLYSIDVSAHDQIAVTISAAQQGSVPDNCPINAFVYDDTGGFLAAGYGTGASNNFAQVNTSGDLRNIVAARSGFYTIAISAHDSGCLQGGYKLAVAVNSVPAPLLPYQEGGTVQGHLYQPDGTTPIAGGRVRIQTNTAPRLFIEQTTDAQGAYEFDNVPIQFFTLHAVPDALGRYADVAGRLLNIGDLVVLDISLYAATTIDAHVVQLDGSPLMQQLPIAFTASTGTTSTSTDTQGHASATVFGNTPILVRALSDSASAEQTVQPADGQTVSVTLVMAGSPLHGHVVDSAGTPVPGVSVNAYRHGTVNGAFGFAQTNSLGEFDLGILPGGASVQLTATDPVDGTAVNQVFTTVAGQATDRTITLPGRGSLTGTVRTPWGTPIARAQVSASYLVNEDGGGHFTNVVSTTSADDGTYRLDHLPAAVTLTAMATEYINYQSDTHYDSAPRDITIANVGDVAQADLVIAEPGGRITAHITTADGVPLDGQCFVVAGNITDLEDCSAPFQLATLPAGQSQVTASTAVSTGEFLLPGTQLDSRNVNVTDAQTVDVVLGPISVVKGTMRFSNGDPVQGAQITLTDVDGNAQYTTTGDDGTYRFVEVKNGTVTIDGQDVNSGLQAHAVGTLTDPAVPLILDLSLQGTGSISGVVYDAGGQARSNALVYAHSSGLDVDRLANADSDGHYDLEQIALGDIALAAVTPDSQNAVTASTTLSSIGQHVDVDLHLPVAGSLSGQVKQPGGAAMPNACINLWSTAEGWDSQLIYASGVADAQGAYGFAELFPGPFRVQASDCNSSYPRTVGLADGVIQSNAQTTLDIDFGNGVSLSQDIAEALSGFTYSVYGAGDLYASSNVGGVADPFNFGGVLLVNGAQYPYQQAAYADATQRDLTLGAMSVSGLRVSRRVYIPAGRGFVRYVDVLSNESSVPISASVQLQYQRADTAPLLDVSPQTTGSRYAVQKAANGDPNNAAASGYVFAGAGAVSLPAVQIQDQLPAVSWNWNTTVPPGQTVAFLQFVLVRAPSGLGDLEQQAAHLSDMTEPGMFDDLSAQDKAAIKNFVVSP